MPYCPVCKHRFDAPATECPKDGVALVGELPFQTVDAEGITWVEIAGLGTDDEARLLQGFLEAEEIPAQIESLRFSMEPVNLGQMSEIRVYVPSEYESQALRLLEQRRREFASLRDDDDVVTDEGPADIDEDAETVIEGEKA
ncbi:MAG TPA: hypothetical protein VMS56_04750 [Thermoanaerobaculia bacterium]|nr:hypothetical protein [Thermoanaerobaculia bacterium]